MKQWATHREEEYLGASNREEARSPEDRHRGEHHRLPDKDTPRFTLRSTKNKDGTTTSNRAKEIRTRSWREVEKQGIEETSLNKDTKWKGTDQEANKLG